MSLRKRGFTFVWLGALFAVPILWSLGAEAKSVFCAISNSNITGPGLFTFNNETFSVECSGEGMTVRGRARTTSTQTGVQVQLLVASGTTSSKSAIAFGYNSSQQFISGCTVIDTSTVGTFVNQTCSQSVHAVMLEATGVAP
jgi:hypothetical protein